MIKMRRNSTRTAGPLATLFMGVISTFVGGLTLYFFALPNYNLAKDSLSWPSTEGTVLTSDVLTKTSKDSDGRYKTMFSPRVVFEYFVDGKKYQSDNISIGENGISYGSHSTAINIANQYPKGTNVKVFYSTKYLSLGILENGVQNHHYYIIAGMSLFIIVGLFVFGKGISMISSKKKSSTSYRDLSKSNSDTDQSHENQKWYIVGSSKDYGPYTFEKLMNLHAAGRISDSQFCYPEGDKGSQTRLAYIRVKNVA